MRTRILTAALAAGLGTTRLVETVKEALVFVPPPEYKSAFASLVAGAAGAVLADGDWRDRSMAAAGAIGIAMITHECVAFLSGQTDKSKVHVMRAASARAS